jgi:hypothetical protein
VRSEENTVSSWLKISIFLFTPLFLVPHVIADDPGRDELYQPAGTFLVEQFRLKDVILVGESHRIREHAEFIARMIPLLHKNGINLLFSEFADCADSAIIDSLITGKVYDGSRARYISWKNMWDWAYKEYTDVYYAAWKVNQNLLPGETPFRIIGIEQDVPMNVEPELWWARVISRYSLEKNKKALVWCGLHHSFTTYNQPYVVDDSLQGFVTTRLGNLLYRKFPERVMTVVLHAPLKAAIGAGVSYVLPGDGTIDSVAYSLPAGQQEIGFNTNESWLGNCTLESSFYATGYVGFTLKKMCQGYIVVKPVCGLHMVTIIPGFIDSSNVMETRKMAEMGDLSPQAFNDTIRTWLETESRFLLDVQKRVCFSPRQ